MAEKYSASASKISAIDYKGKAHKVSEFSVSQTLSQSFEIIATIISNNFDLKGQLGQLITIDNRVNNTGTMTTSHSYNGAIVKIDTISFEKDLQYTAYRITHTSSSPSPWVRPRVSILAWSDPESVNQNCKL